MDQQYQHEAQRVSAPQPAPRPKGTRLSGCLIALAVVGVLGIVVVLGVVLLIAVAAVGMVGEGAVTTEAFHFEEVSVGGKRGAPKIVCVPVEGIIRGAVLPGVAASPTSVFVGQLAKAKSDPQVRGLIIYVDSPGGGITASDIMHREINRFRADTGGMPVVACLTDVAASGGYYVAVAADRIIAHPTTITGSIGVLMPMYDATGLMKKIGVRDESIAAGEFKQIGSPLKERTEEQKAREREMLEGIIRELHERFMAVVAEGRGMTPGQVRPLADGRIFTSRQALEHDLIDEIGYESDAIAAIKKLAGVSEVELVRYRRVVPLSEILSIYSKGPRLTLDVGHGVGPSTGKPMFLWVPPVTGREAPDAR